MATKKSIFSISYLMLDTNFLLLTSIEGLISLFDLNGKVIAAYNINHPLPLMWNVVYTK